MKKIFFTSLFMSLLTMSAYSLEFDTSELKTQFYGQLHMSGFYQFNDAATMGTGIADSNFDLSLQDFSRFGAKLIFGNFTGVAELQLVRVSTGYFEDNIFRRLSISYNFSNDSILTIGKDWTPIGYSFEQYADGYNALWGYGAIWDNRQALIGYSIAGFDIAVVYNQGATMANNDDAPSYIENEFVNSGDNIQKLPKFEISYTNESDFHDFKIYAAYTRFQDRVINESTADTAVLIIDSYVAGFGGKLNFGGAYVTANVFFGENLATYGILPYSHITPAMNSSTSVSNVQSGGCAGAVGYIFNDTFEVAAGGGATFSSNNGFSTSNSNTMYSFFFNVPLKVTSFLKVIPEVSYFYNGRDFDGNYLGASLSTGVYLLAEF